MAKTARPRRFRILLSDGLIITAVSRQGFEAHLAAHRIESFKHDGRKAEPKKAWLSYIDFNTGDLTSVAREAKIAAALSTNSKHLIEQVIFRPPYNEWLQ